MRFMKMAKDRSDAGITIIETTVALALSAFIAGAVISVQSTSTEKFEASLMEHRVNAVSRDGVSAIRKELRSCLNSSVRQYSYPGNNGDPIFAFQQAVNFDTANGITNWGGGDVVGGHVEYAILGTDLIRRIVSSTGATVEQTVMVDNLDLDPPKGGYGFPAIFVWDASANTVTVEVNRVFTTEGRTMRRKLETLIYIDPVFNF